MKQTIHDILGYFREEALHNRDLGDKFERLIAAYLAKDPYYANHFSDVWLWMEWSGRNNLGDTRIDLVAQERATGDSRRSNANSSTRRTGCKRRTLIPSSRHPAKSLSRNVSSFVRRTSGARTPKML